MPALRTSRSYNKLPDTELSKFAGGTVEGLTGSTTLPSPPVTPNQITALKKTFDSAVIAANKGGSLATATKNAARVALSTALDKNASYVDINCDDDLTILLSSGYEPVSTNRAQTVLNPPEVISADYYQNGQIKFRVAGDPNRRAIVGRCKTLDGDWGPTISFRNTRNIIFGQLVAGVTYVFQLCGLGGSTGQSDWSDPVTKIAV